MGLLLVIIASIYSIVNNWGKDIGKNPIVGLNEASSQVLIHGKGYSLNNRQEEEYKEKQEKFKKHIEEKLKDETSAQSRIEHSIKQAEKLMNITGGQSEENIQTGNSLTGENTQTNNNGHENESDGTQTEGESVSKNPTIITNLKDGQFIKGNKLIFTVKGINYKNTALSSFYITVSVNGIKITSTGLNADGSYTYQNSRNLKDGYNEVNIMVVDKEGYQSTKNYRIKVDINAQRPASGEVTVRVEAKTLGLGTLGSKKITIYEGDTAYIVADKAIREMGYEPVWSENSSEFGGKYLYGIKGDSLFEGWTYDKIPIPVKKKLEDINASEMGLPDIGMIKQEDVYARSGWIYDVDGISGAFTENGISEASVSDGDIITLAFTLHMGYEYNGTWWMYGQW